MSEISDKFDQRKRLKKGARAVQTTDASKDRIAQATTSEETRQIQPTKPSSVDHFPGGAGVLAVGMGVALAAMVVIFNQARPKDVQSLAISTVDVSTSASSAPSPTFSAMALPTTTAVTPSTPLPSVTVSSQPLTPIMPVARHRFVQKPSASLPTAAITHPAPALTGTPHVFYNSGRVAD